MAKNYMADVAGIFGLKFGEFFKLKDDGHIRNDGSYIENQGTGINRENYLEKNPETTIKPRFNRENSL